MDECCNEGETSSATPPQRPQLGDPGTQKGAERWKHHHWVPPIPTANVSFLVPQIRLKAKNIQDNPLVLGWQAGNNKKEIQLAMSLCVCVCVSGCLCVTERRWSRETHRASEKIDCPIWHSGKVKSPSENPRYLWGSSKWNRCSTTSEIALVLKTDATPQLKPRLVPCSWYWKFYVVLN